MATASVEILINTILNDPQPFDVTPYQAGWFVAPGKIALLRLTAYNSSRYADVAQSVEQLIRNQ